MERNHKQERQTDSDVCFRFICNEECLETRPLWEEVFSEDSQLFTDYYFRVKAPLNEGFVLEGTDGIRAMLFLTPEKMRIYENTVQSAYIVGVATKETYRHRGYMAQLLQKSFETFYERKMPFIFLMPASAAIYEPFGFRFIYDRPMWEAESLQMDRLEILGRKDIGKMAAFSNQFLDDSAGVYICRDEAYDKVLLEEIAAQEGMVLGYFEEPGGFGGDGRQLKGICLYTCEAGEANIQEVLALPETEALFVTRREEKKPCIMARILHLPSLLGLLRARQADTVITFGLLVEDEQIPQNNGLFVCTADSQRCSVDRVDSAVQPLADEIAFFWQGTIAELVERIFGYEPGYGQEAGSRNGKDALWELLGLLEPVWINEIV